MKPGRFTLFVFPCVGVVAGLGCFFFGSARHLTREERLEKSSSTLHGRFREQSIVGNRQDSGYSSLGS